MKLIYKVTLRLALILLPLITLWAVIFYYTMIEEINDESDDSLVEYAETIIRRQLAGYPLPLPGNGSNNSYTIEPIDSGGYIEPYMTFHDEMVYIPEQKDTEPARVLTTTFIDDNDITYKLQVTMPTFERDDLRNAIFWYILVLYALLVLVVLFATWAIFYRSMRPLYKLLRWFDNYTPGKRPSAIPESDVIEFQKLGKAASLAVDRAEEYFEQQKQFIGNASHELQTPLAVIGNRIEWIVDNTTLNEEQYSELSKIQRTLGRLVRTNKTLLLLTKIDNGQFPETADVDIVTLVNREIEVYSDIFAHKEIKSNLKLPQYSIVKINESLAYTLIGNLLKNAYLHSPEGATVTVQVDSRSIIVSNDGDTPLDAERVFNRFYHDGKNGSTGLGLALVNSICRYYDFKVGYRFEEKQHIFSVEWFNSQKG
ncbi:MAG: HAMP domain-containing histidine kinase [Bacteroidaceae bacterium]|nr:HAMP domain-containing histidine kinase [Bacteroidaceae bacterium]